MIKRLFAFFVAVLMLLCAFSVSAVTTYTADDGYRYIRDHGDVLTDEEEYVLSVKLGFNSSRAGADIVVVTARDVYDLREFAEDYYLDYDYAESGVMFLYCEDINEGYILVSGGCNAAIDLDKQDDIFDKLTPYIKAEYYADAFQFFGTLSEQYITDYVQAGGDLDDYDDLGFDLDAEIKWYHFLIIAAVIGVIVGFISVGVMKSKLKSVRYNYRADNYIMRDTFRVTESREIFLYRNIIRTPRPKSNSGGRGGFSGGGRSFGGSSRRF